jgi:hypothetical protein
MPEDADRARNTQIGDRTCTPSTIAAFDPIRHIKLRRLAQLDFP